MQVYNPSITKLCPKCGNSFPCTPEFFYRNPYAKNGLHSLCKSCKNGNKQRWRSNQRKRVKLFLRQLKDKPCLDCEKSYPHFCMDFHHRDQSVQHIGITKMMLDNLWSEEEIIAEIAKCDVLCAICHRIRHWGSSDE